MNDWSLGRGVGLDRKVVGAIFTGELESGAGEGALWEHMKVGYKFSKTDKKGYVALKHTFIPLGKLKWAYFVYMLEIYFFSIPSDKVRWGGGQGVAATLLRVVKH